MNSNFSLTSDTLNNIYKFGLIYGKLEAFTNLVSNKFIQKLSYLNKNQSALASVIIDRELYERITLESKDFVHLAKFISSSELVDLRYFLGILDNFETIFQDYNMISSDMIDAIHNKLINISGTFEHKKRNEDRMLYREFIDQNGIHKQVSFPVTTKPDEIDKRLDGFLTWVKKVIFQMNPIILASICHQKIAEIHPYDDGNGRLTRIFSRGILYLGKIDTNLLMSIDEYYLLNQNQYYDLLKESIDTKDLTKWIEFYSYGILETLNRTIDLLYRISGGTVDIRNGKITKLTEKEQEVINFIIKNTNASGAEIARELKVARQNIHLILKKLDKRGILAKYGKNTSVRYKLN